MQKCKEIFSKKVNTQNTHAHTHTHTHIHTNIHTYTYILKMQNRFVKTKCNKRSIALKIEKRLPEQVNILKLFLKFAQILNIYIRIIALYIRKGMDVAAEMVTIKNLL